METVHIENKALLPELITSFTNPEHITGISYINEGKRYVFSNELGHKVTASNGYDQRPMTKTEFKSIRAKMACSILNSQHFPEQLIEELEKLDFGIGHANGTFEVATPCMTTTNFKTLIINLGTARYIYNQDTNSVFHIDHSKLINGTFLQDGPEKERIINKINSSKTIAKKLSLLKN